MTRPANVGGFGDRLSWRRHNLSLAWRYRGLTPKLMKNYLRVLAGRRVLRGVEFAITYDCNFNCPHCLTKTLIDDARPPLTADEILHTARQIERLGGIYINYTGGEPILRDDIFEIVERTARLSGLIVTLASNGYALDRDNLPELKRRGLAMLALSLDGPSPETHDVMRGFAGSYERVEQVIRLAREIALPVWLTAVVTRENLRNGAMATLAERTAQQGLPLTLNLPYPVGAWEGADVVLTENDYQRYLQLLTLPHVRWEGSSNWLREGCPAGTEKIYVTPYGDVFPCAVIHRSYGNVREQPLATIYERLGRTPCFDGRRKPCLVAEAPELWRECLRGDDADQ
ncbi:MAG TPA: radical SAM protein [bacterium]|nr:radical SAM protein [bacterium]